MKKILIIGATSAIAEAAARIWAMRGESLFLVGRDVHRLEIIAADLRVRGASSVACFQMDACDYALHEAMLESAESVMGAPDIVLVAHGSLPDQKACEASVELTLKEIETNGLSVVALLTRLGARFAERRAGVLAVISSVAGDRGRQSNYVYGAAKGMVTLFMQGLRNRLSRQGVQVLTIKPGFVDTPMTSGFSKGALWVKPDVIARGIVRAIDRGASEIYLPGFWRLIMLVIRHIPESIFKRLSL